MRTLKSATRVNKQLKFFGKGGRCFHSTYSMVKPRIRIMCKVSDKDKKYEFNFGIGYAGAQLRGLAGSGGLMSVRGMALAGCSRSQLLTQQSAIDLQNRATLGLSGLAGLAGLAGAS